MKQPKKLTRTQKEAVYAAGLMPDEWAFLEESDFYYKVMNKNTGKIKSVDKYKRRAKC